MKKLMYFIFTMFAAVFLFADVSGQAPPDSDTLQQKSEGELLTKKYSSQEHGSATKFQVSTMLGINIISSERQASKAVGSTFSNSPKNMSLATKPAVEYYLFHKAGIGVSYNSFQSNFEATRYEGSEFISGSWFFFFYTGDSYIAHYDIISLKNTGSMFSGYGTYKLVEYSREKRQQFEITARAGLSVAFINEQQELTASLKRGAGNSNYYFDESTASYRFSRTACTGFVGAQLLIHVTRYFSFVIADLTQNFGLINPTVPETSVTVNNSKTVTASKHKLTAGGFTCATGLAVHF